jgi:hypothetical protein
MPIASSASWRTVVTRWGRGARRRPAPDRAAKTVGQRGPAALLDIDKRGSGSSDQVHERLSNFPLRLGDVRTAATECISGS